MKRLCVSLMILGWFAVPNFVLADWLPYSQRFWTGCHTVNRGLLKRNSLHHRVGNPTFEGRFNLKLGKDNAAVILFRSCPSGKKNLLRGYAQLS